MKELQGQVARAHKYEPNSYSPCQESPSPAASRPAAPGTTRATAIGARPAAIGARPGGPAGPAALTRVGQHHGSSPAASSSRPTSSTDVHLGSRDVVASSKTLAQLSKIRLRDARQAQGSAIPSTPLDPDSQGDVTDRFPQAAETARRVAQEKADADRDQAGSVFRDDRDRADSAYSDESTSDTLRSNETDRALRDLRSKSPERSSCRRQDSMLQGSPSTITLLR